MNQADLYGDDVSHDDSLLARQVALTLLETVLSRKVPLDQALDDSRDLPMLSPRDRGFVRMVVSTTLRRLGQIDDLIYQAGDRRPLPQPLLLHHLLRMGVAQILFMNVPDHAAVNTAVEIAELRGMQRQKGFVNAILRRITREGQEWLSRQDESRLNIPEWLLKSWVDDYGLRTAAEIGLANLGEAALDITVKIPAERDYWAQALEATILPTGSLRREPGGSVIELPGFEDGVWWVQDSSAALPAKLFGDLNGVHVIDLCAAPGGKTAQLAAAGASVLALDRSAKRLKRLEENMIRLNLEDQVKCETADAAVWLPRDPVMAILLDAPCTATGTIRRHPDVMALKGPQDQNNLADLQARMLDNAVLMLAPGGILIYCTCSLQKAEGERQIEAFLARNKGKMARKPISAAEIGGLDGAITPDGDVRVLPGEMAAYGGSDGFYIARLVRV
jgi:16S rRNA (cytosine967-C5)-methyltransferase